MQPLNEFRFAIPEILSLLALAQSVYVLVYMGFHAGNLKRAILPALYFMALGTAFFLDFAERLIGGAIPHYFQWQWAAWFIGPPLSVLLILQITQIKALPSWKNFWVLLLVPAAWLCTRVLSSFDQSCQAIAEITTCAVYYEWLVVTGLIAGAFSLLTIWAHRGLLSSLAGEKKAKDRYWLVLTLIMVNLAFLAVMLMTVTPVLTEQEAGLIRTVLGLGFVYIAGTSLFRIYPQTVDVSRGQGRRELASEEKVLAQKIESLLEREKVYQEPSYGRSDLARELEVSETILSTVINDYFGKNLPQLLNERRVEDAKRLLRETDAPVKVIGEEVGFNSSTSFNRVFREETGQTPSAYRKATKTTSLIS